MRKKAARSAAVVLAAAMTVGILAGCGVKDREMKRHLTVQKMEPVLKTIRKGSRRSYDSDSGI